jgi:hypothetical protein
MATRPLTLHDRLGVLSRAVAAIAGGYALGTLGSVALASALPVARAEATLTALQLSFALHAAAAIWAFAARSAWQAWLGIAGPALASGLVVAWLH